MAKPQLRKPKKKVSPVKAIKVGTIDYKDTATLRKFISDRGKIQVVPPIKSTGRHSASVRLHADVVAPLEVNVVPAR